jgi:hypothetical protein
MNGRGETIDCPPSVVPGAIVYVTPLTLSDPAVVAVAGLKLFTCPQTDVVVLAATFEKGHLDTAIMHSTRHKVSIVAFIFI